MEGFLTSIAVHRYADALIAVAYAIIALALLRLAVTRRMVFPICSSARACRRFAATRRKSTRC